MVFAGFALNMPEALDAAKVIKQCITEQPKFVGPDADGYAPGWPTGGGVGQDQRRWNSAFKAIHVGQPFNFPTTAVKSAGSDMKLTLRYLSVSSPVSVVGLMFILLLKNGPGGMTGLDWWLSAGNGAMDTTNERAAAVWWMDRYFKSWPDNTIPNWVRNFYAAHRADIAAPIYSGPGCTYERTTPGAAGDLVATVTGFDANWTGKNWSTGVLSKVRTRVSQRGVQFINIPGTAGIDDTISVSEITPGSGALVPMKHYVQMQYDNVAPNGITYGSEWSPNFSYSDLAGLSGERDVITPISPDIAVAPVFIVAPKMHIPTSPRTTEPDYEEISGTIDPSNFTLVIGEGYCSCAAGSIAEYQLIIGGVPYGARQVSPVFNRPRTLGVGVTCEGRIFINDGVNPEIYADTNTIMYAASPALPADIIFKSDFSGGFDFDWPAVRDSLTAGAQTLQWQPSMSSDVVPPADLEITAADVLQTSQGLIRTVKTAGYPYVRGNFAAQIPLIPGNKYRLTVDIPIGIYKNVTGFMTLDVGSTAGGTDLARSGNIDPYPQPRIHRQVLEFTALDDKCFVNASIFTATGGSNGGDPTMSEMEIKEIPAFSAVSPYPTPYAVPIVLFDTAVSGIHLADFVLGSGSVVTEDGTGLLFGAGSAWGQINKAFHDAALEIGREVRVTINANRVSGSFTASYGIGRPDYVDPDYGTVPGMGTLYKSDTIRSTSAWNTVDTFRIQSNESVNLYLKNRDNSGGWRLNALKVEVL